VTLNFGFKLGLKPVLLVLALVSK